MNSLQDYIVLVTFFVLFIYGLSNIILPLAYALPKLVRLEKAGLLEVFPTNKIVWTPIVWTAILAGTIIYIQEFFPTLLDVSVFLLVIAFVLVIIQLVKGRKMLDADFASSYLPNYFDSKLHEVAVNNYADEMRQFNSVLHQLEKEKIADYFIYSVWTRAGLQLEKRFTLPDGTVDLSPQLSSNPYLLEHFEKIVQHFLNKDARTEAFAMNIWKHSVRALQYYNIPEIQYEFTKMWRDILSTQELWKKYLERLYVTDSETLTLKMLQDTLKFSTQILQNVPPGISIDSNENSDAVTDWVPYGSKDFGIILVKLYQSDFPAEELADPDNTIIGGTPFYTYLNLLDKWHMLERNSNIKKAFSDLDLSKPKNKLKALLISRNYLPEDIDRLMKKTVKNHVEAIMHIINFEFLHNNPVDPKGSVWKKQRPAFIDQDIPKIEAAYKKSRGDESF